MSSQQSLIQAANEALSVPSPKPDLSKFSAVLSVMSERSEALPEFISFIKVKMGKDNTPKTRLLTLEMIEFLSCKGNSTIISEFNRKSFLQHLNGLLADPNLDPFVKVKGLAIVQFFKHHFANQATNYPNFQWYHATLTAKGIKLPPYHPSPYSDSASSGSGAGTLGKMNEKQRKLFDDLNVVSENVTVANSMIDERETVALNEVMFNLKVMEKKLLTLPDKLTQAGEDFLYKHSLAVIQDIGFTIDRHYRMTSKLAVPKFESKASKVIREASQSQKEAVPVHVTQDEIFGTHQTLFSKDDNKQQNQELFDLNPVFASPSQSAQNSFSKTAPIPTSNYQNDNIYALDLTGMSQARKQDNFGNTGGYNFTKNTHQIAEVQLNPVVIQNTSFVKPPTDGTLRQK